MPCAAWQFWSWRSSLKNEGRPIPAVIARSEATKQSIFPFWPAPETISQVSQGIFPFPPERTHLYSLPVHPGQGVAMLMQVPSEPKARWRVRIAFLCLFAVFVALSFGAWYLADLSRLLDRNAARDSRAMVQGVTEPAQ